MKKMRRELRQTPTVLTKLYESEFPRIEKYAKFLADQDIRQVTFVARGSSDNACLYGKYIVESLLNIPAHLAAPSILTVYKSHLSLSNTLVIAVSQSGEGTDINEYTADAVASGAPTLAITNHVRSPLAQTADFVIPLHAGREESVAATKTYVSECYALLALVACWAKHKVALDQIVKLPEITDRIIEIEEDVKAKVSRYRYMDRAVTIGRGYHYATAKEFSLKLMETSYLPVQAFSMADFMHGPIAMINDGFPTFLFVARGKMERPMLNILKDLHEKKSETVVFSNTNETKRYATTHFIMPRSVAEIATPIPYIIPAQFFAMYLADLKGINPDKPKFLSKVTKTR